MGDLQTILDVVSDRLHAEGVECILVGGFAVNHYGYTRNTLDIDFLIAAGHANIVRRCLTAAGFINVCVEDNVIFFEHPDTRWRADFLKVDAETMRKLLSRAETATIRGRTIKVPALKDLLALKIFALAHAPTQRAGKDLLDIVWLSVLHNLDLAADLLPLCEQYGTRDIFDRIATEIKALKQL